jgi:GT2 family glycosyltransferase
VTYHSYDSLNDYLQSVEQAIEAANDTVDVTVLVADNTVPAVPVAYSPRHFTLRVLATGGNLGYFGAVRHVMQQVSPMDFDYSIVSNVDVLLEEDFFTSLASHKTDCYTAWLAPAIWSQTLHFDFNPQSMNRYSLKKMRLLRLMFKYPLLLKLKQKLLHTYHDVKVSQPGNIYAGHGSFIILTKEFFSRCGIIDYPLFLYGEEIYLAEECRKHHLNVIYTPDIRVQDIGRVSTGKFSSSQYCKYNYLAIDYIINTYYLLK